MRKERARELRFAAVLSAQGATDAQAASMPSLYPEWASDTAYGGQGQDRIVSHGGGLYRCIQSHASQAGWEPGPATAALWERIDVTHAGTAADPIPAARGMAYEEGLYYSEGTALYHCTRSTGQPVDYIPSQLVGQYFEEVAA